MPKSMFAIVAGVAFALIAGCHDPASEPADMPGGATENLMKPAGVVNYEVTMENLAPAGSQPLSPPVIATHAPPFRLFHIGGLASDELRQIAEDAVNGPMMTFLGSSDAVYDVAVGGGPIPPGGSVTLSVTGTRGYHKLSLVSMLVNTNDGVTGADKITLPEKGSKVWYLRSYDAGTEENTEMQAHIPGPCCGNPLVRVPTDERIRFHKGILGVGDLDPSVYGWTDPIARLTITRVN